MGKTIIIILISALSLNIFCDEKNQCFSNNIKEHLAPNSGLKSINPIQEIIINKYHSPRNTYGKIYIDYYSYKINFNKDHMKKQFKALQARGQVSSKVIPIHLVNYSEKIQSIFGRKKMHSKYKDIAEGLMEAYLSSSSIVSPYTQSAILALQQLDIQGKTIVDLGSGDGVLSIVAAKLGAEHIYAIDDIKGAQYLGKMNAKRNQVEDQITFLHESFSPNKLDENQKDRLKQADIILMNQPSSTRDNFLDKLFNEHPGLKMKCIIFAGGRDDLYSPYGIMSDDSNHPISRSQGFQNMGLKPTYKIVIDDHQIKPPVAFIFENLEEIKNLLSSIQLKNHYLFIQYSS